MNTLKRPLPLAEELIKSTGLEMTHAYDDLIFAEHNPFLLRFNDKYPDQIFIHFNSECNKSDKIKLLKTMEIKASKIGLKICLSQNFSIKQKVNSEEIEITFEAIL
ncbi:MAG: hypothetical protein PF517_05240 [Salinivirgaceae bacterium]|jgi:hypothetical protein|nr:hypothetical protein [Salinivirgaceae bacterium]